MDSPEAIFSRWWSHGLNLAVEPILSPLGSAVFKGRILCPWALEEEKGMPPCTRLPVHVGSLNECCLWSPCLLLFLRDSRGLP